jgi:hypothetical protein
MVKIKVTAQQRANALEALNVMWPSIKPEKVVSDLQMWTAVPEDCNSPACFGGWVARWPEFQKQGVHAGLLNGEPILRVRGRTMYANEVAGVLFGERSLFDVRRGFPYLIEADRRVSSHQIVTRRLQWLIENSEVV